jgi:predicted DCC family thiol-disulfide oxidoreductase YuxK
VSALPAQPRLLVLYDADCGFCSRSARLLRRLDHGRHLRLMPLQDAGEIVGAPPAQVLLDAMHVRDGRGRWTVAGAAWLRIAEEIPLLRPLAFAGRLALIRSFVEWAYAQVAGNRHRISWLLGDDDCPIGRRTQ